MKKIYIAQILLSLILFLFFWDHFLLSPLHSFITAIHEACHGFTTLITGGSIKEIALNSKSGHLISQGGFYPLISISGYIGSSILGSFLISSKNKGFILFSMVSFVLVLSIIYIDTYISLDFLFLILLSLALYISIFKQYYLDNVSFFIGTLLAVQSFQDIKMYLFYIPSETDSGLLANWFGLPWLAIPISIVILLISLFVWYLGFRKLLR